MLESGGRRSKPWVLRRVDISPVGRRSGPEQKVWGHHTQQRSGLTLVLEGVSAALPCGVTQTQPHLARWLKSKNTHSLRSPNTTENRSRSACTFCVQVLKTPQEAPRPCGELTCSPPSPCTWSASRLRLWRVQSLSRS